MTSSSGKFDPARAGEYAIQSRIGLAGYDACHELAAGLLSVSLDRRAAAHVLVVGAGGSAQEIVCAARLQPEWRFTAVDPSRPMLDKAVQVLEEAGLTAQVEVRLGLVEDLPPDCLYDAATIVGVVHHLPGQPAKQDILRATAARLGPGAPLILAGNRGVYGDDPLFLAAWGERWRQTGAGDAEIEAKLGTILRGADPPASDQAVEALLRDAGFDPPRLFFSSLFWGGWITRRR